MNVTKEIQKIENSAVKLTATIAQADVESGYKSEFAKYAKNIQLPGFRKGHVPTKIIEQKYGEALKQEITGGLIDSALNEILQSDDAKDFRPLPYSQPRLEDNKLPELDLTKDYTFTVIYDVFPAVEVKNFSGITIKEPQVEIGDKEIEDELKSIQERNAVVIDKKDEDPLANGDIVTIDYKELDDSGNTVEGRTREGFVFTVGSGENIYKIDEEIIGMKKNDTKEITKTYAADDKDPELAGKTKKISVTVKAIKIRDLPAIDDDLAQDVSEKYHNLEELKADLRKQIPPHPLHRLQRDAARRRELLRGRVPEVRGEGEERYAPRLSFAITCFYHKKAPVFRCFTLWITLYNSEVHRYTAGRSRLTCDWRGQYTQS